MTQYSAKDIQVSRVWKPVRKRPSMYIGGVMSKVASFGLEIVDNAVDEYLNGHADSVTVTLHKDGNRFRFRIMAVDSRRLASQVQEPALELILTTLHSGAKFGEGENYIHSGDCMALDPRW